MDAVIGGSQLGSLALLDGARREAIRTPYGDPSGPITIGAVAGSEVAFLPRHGDPHVVPPHRINYRANIWALRELGARNIVAIATSGGMRADFAPGSLVVPDQIIDYTYGHLTAVACTGRSKRIQCVSLRQNIHIMRTNIVIDDQLMEEALSVTGLKTKREAVELGLRTLLRLSKQEQIRRFRGKLNWQGDLDAMRTDK